MNFLIVPFFLILIIGSLGIIFIYNLQSVNPQSDIKSSILSNISVKIISPSEGKKVPTGKLTISGISSDNQEKNCIVHVDWNDLKPFQPVRAAGPGGVDDFSEWIFTYDSNYHEIIEGSNELTSKITCLDGNKPLTKWNSINVTGYTSLFTPSSSISNLNTTTAIESTDNQQGPLQTVMPGSNPKTNASNTIKDPNTTTSLQLSNVLPVKKNTTTAIESTDNQQGPLQTVMPGSNPKTNATNTIKDPNTTTSLKSSNPNTTSVEKNTTTSSQLSNLSDSEIEMVVPNESINEKQINNTNTGSISENGNFTTNDFSQSKLQKPRIDLDEQPPTALEEEQQQQQPPSPPPSPPTALEEEQQQQQPPSPPPSPPTALEEEQQQQQPPSPPPSPPTALEEEQQQQQPPSPPPSPPTALEEEQQQQQPPSPPPSPPTALEEEQQQQQPPSPPPSPPTALEEEQQQQQPPSPPPSPPTALEEEQQQQQPPSPPPSPPTALEEEQQQQQPPSPPPSPPTALEEEQQQQQPPSPPPSPPTALEEEQQQQPPNLNNQSEAFEAQPPQSENSPTKGVFPPFKLPSLFP